MIIGIAGYSGSGKDEVCSKIQHLDGDSNWQRKKWAGKLKQIASILTGISENMFEDIEFKKSTLGIEWNYNDLGKIGGKKNQPLTVRELLQKIGTDALRDGLHPNVWVNALMAEYVCDCCNEYPCDTINHKDTGQDIGYQYPNWIITDTRFPNEAQAIKDAGGIVIRVDRLQISPINTHYSEIALDGWDFDYYIENSGTHNDLYDRVEEFLATLIK
jgi:hypothetical protein